jgi:L-alanine-DL-glutamate epimerase-like enolase superfamily enzyme
MPPSREDRRAVTEIETVALRIPLRPETAVGAALWGDELAAADSLLVKVTTSDGIEGWGEAFGFRAVDSAALAVEELIAPLCIGRDATAIGPLMHEVERKLHVFGRGGAVTYGLSAVDIALWDIAGKRAGVPVSQLLGGGVSVMPCYASLACYTEPDRVRAVLRRVVDAGFNAVKLHESSVPAMRAARDEAGTGVELIVDAGCAWTLAHACAMAGEIAALRLKFLEEPLWPPENVAGLAELRRATGLPVSSGENVATVIEFDHMLAAGAVDFAQPSPAKLGGITALRSVFPLATVHNVPVMTHSFYDGPGLLAAIQVTAALGSVDSMIEWRWFDLQASLYGAALAPVDGRIPVPAGPGLGIDPDPDVISAYRRTPTA